MNDIIDANLDENGIYRPAHQPPTVRPPITSRTPNFRRADNPAAKNAETEYIERSEPFRAPTLHSDFWTPLAQSFGLSALAGLLSVVVLWMEGGNLLIALPLFFSTWLSTFYIMLQDAKKTHMKHELVERTSEPTPTIVAQPLPPQQPRRVEIVERGENGGVRHWQVVDLPPDIDVLLPEIARLLIEMNVSLSRTKLCQRPHKVMSQPQYHQFVQAMDHAGFVRKEARKTVLLESGKDFLKSILEGEND